MQPSTTSEPDFQGVRDLRARLLDHLLRYVFFASLLALIPSLWLGIKVRLWPVVAADLAATGLLAALAFLPALAYRLRVSGLVGLPYVLGVLLIAWTGPSGAGHLYIFAFVFLAALFGGRRAIILANGLAVLTHAAFLVARAGGFLHWEQGFDSVLVISFNFILVSLVLSFSVNYLLMGLARAGDEERKMGQQLALLVREIEHRVKNNLQVIMAIVNLRAREGRDPASSLAEIKSSLAAIAAVHKILYRRDSHSLVELRKLIEELIADYRLLATHVSFDLRWEGEDLELDGEKAVTLGLLINEIAMNSLKHAPTDGGRGSFFIEARRDGEAGLLTLRLGDGGGGAAEAACPDPAPPRSGRAGGLGLTIIDALARQLRASFFREEGAWIYVLRLPIAP